MTGLGGAIEYGIGVTALNVNGGTFGATGVTYNINNTQAGTTTTINGGPNENYVQPEPRGQLIVSTTCRARSWSTATAAPIRPTLFDQNGAGGDYAITDTTVAAAACSPA